MPLTRSERGVIKAMIAFDRPATIVEIAREADSMAWTTANKALNHLLSEKVVSIEEIENRKFWILNELPEKQEDEE